MHPVLFQLPWGPANAYGTLILLGGVLCIPGLVWEAYDRQIAQGRRLSFIVDVYLVLVFGAFLGGRLLHVLTLPGPFGSHLHTFLAMRDGGFVFFGSLLAILAGWAWLGRRYDASLASLCDMGATWVPLGHALGRMGCWAAGCCWGAPTDTAWGVRFPLSSVAAHAGEVAVEEAGTVPLVPVQLIESGALLGLFGLLLIVRLTRGPSEAPWRATARYAIGYGVIRFLTEGLRGDASRGLLLELPFMALSRALGLPADHPWLLSVSQAVAVAMVLGGLVLLRMRARTH